MISESQLYIFWETTMADLQIYIIPFDLLAIQMRKFNIAVKRHDDDREVAQQPISNSTCAGESNRDITQLSLPYPNLLSCIFV